MLNKKSLSRTGKAHGSVLILSQVHTSLPREFIEQSAMAVDLAYRSPMDRITVAGQRLILTDFAFQPPFRENRHHYRIKLLNFNCKKYFTSKTPRRQINKFARCRKINQRAKIFRQILGFECITPILKRFGFVLEKAFP